MEFSSAMNPKIKGKAYHINLSKGDIPPYVLLPGDPARVGIIADMLEDKRTLATHREYTSAGGTYGGASIGVCSTGIGGPSTAIAIEELASIGCHTFIRVGSTGVLQEDISCGDVIINTAAVRFDGTSKQYIFSEYPASANYEVTLALIQACETAGITYHIGISASTDSFYVGQGRPGFNNYLPSNKESIIDSLEAANVLNFEMEASTLFTLGNIYKLRTGCICTVFANRKTNEFITRGEDKASKVACDAVKILYKWDDLKKHAGKKYFFPELGFSKR